MRELGIEVEVGETYFASFESLTGMPDDLLTLHSTTLYRSEEGRLTPVGDNHISGLDGLALESFGGELEAVAQLPDVRAFIAASPAEQGRMVLDG